LRARITCVKIEQIFSCGCTIFMAIYLDKANLEPGDGVSDTGHTVHLKAKYTHEIKNDNQTTKKIVDIIYKQNKFGKPDLSLKEVAFAKVALRFFQKNSTADQHIVKKDDVIDGLTVEHIKYVIDRRETTYEDNGDIKAPGYQATYYEFNEEKTEYDTKKDIKDESGIPYYFLNQFFHGFFAEIMENVRTGKVSVDLESQADILTGSYTLEEDDFHKGNSGFYIIRKNDKPHFVFFKIDHDLMFVDSIMSFLTRRLFHLFHTGTAFSITKEDLMRFPVLKDSTNGYWPGNWSILSNPLAPKNKNDYIVPSEVNAFAHLATYKEFNTAKWLSFYKHILVPEETLEAGLKECLDEDVPADKALLDLIMQSVVARQARLRAVLFTIKEFRDCIGFLTQEERKQLVTEACYSGSDKLINRVLLQEQAYQDLCTDKDISIEDDVFNDKTTPLHVSIILGDYRYVETMDMFGAFINQQDSLEMTPLDYAIKMYESDIEAPEDIRKDYRSIMKHLLEHGAVTSKYKQSQAETLVSDYRFKTSYMSRTYEVTKYEDLKKILEEIGRDHKYCLKYKKNLVIACVSGLIKKQMPFILATENDKTDREDMRDNLIKMMRALKKDLNGEVTSNDCASLSFIRLSRSWWYIIRRIFGEYVNTTSLSTLNTLIDDTLYTITPQPKLNLFSFFGTASASDIVVENMVFEDSNYLDF
jgi:hypothetical protein